MVFRNLLGRIVILFRLAVIVSLVGYTLPNANAAMHGVSALQAEATITVDHAHGSHGHDDLASGNHDADQAQSGHHGGNDDTDKSGKQNCCQDFCMSMALIACNQAETRLVASSIRYFIDDSKNVGQITLLNRPPNI
ncbi:hypothetical protein [Agrobacterium rubi]|uniref:DUF2946 domain-containing protein n=1 Tax=Agrobacterium rubi TaxID=28099 RepID=A0ABX2JGT0_9HYPH|nr:hypothetical protein [Agrobacterium rubi]NTE89415.1 hypothetical protein [Agrobacterium rubi]NTF39551.1 hypothetical protein [Agrobacterium rubi]